MKSKDSLTNILAILLTVILLIMPAFACGVTPPQATAPDKPTNTSEPQSPLVIEPSFPDGAPALNQTAELVFTIKTMARDIRNVDSNINLPDAFELVSGDPSWAGDLHEGEIRKVCVFIKAVKTGNYEIEMLMQIDKEANGGYGGTAHSWVYVRVEEDSAEWGTFAPWRPKEPVPPGVEPVPGMPPSDGPSAPIKVELKMPEPPRLNEKVALTLNVWSKYDLKGIDINITLPDDAFFASDNLTQQKDIVWQRDLKSDQPFTHSSNIIFTKPGKYAIEGTASYAISEKNGWGDLDIIYVTIGADKSEFGWPRTGPVGVQQIKKGDIEPVPSAFTDEPSLEGRPSPPAISINGTIEKQLEHHSITVTGNWYYYTQSGDYRINPTTQVPAETFLVELCSDSGQHKNYGYTDSQGHFSIPGVDPSGGIKAVM